MNDNTHLKYTSATRIAKEAGCDPKLVQQHLVHCYINRLTYMDKGDEKPIVRFVKKENKCALLLSTHPNALKAFWDYCIQKTAYFVLPQKKEGMLSTHDLRVKYGRTHQIYKDLVEQAYRENITFEENGIKKGVVIPVRSPYAPALVIQPSPKALNAFLDFCKEMRTPIQTNIIPKINDQMLSAASISTRYGINFELLNQLLGQYHQKNVCYQDENGSSHPLVQKVKSEHMIIFAVENNHSALLELKTRLKKADIAFRPQQTNITHLFPRQNERSN